MASPGVHDLGAWLEQLIAESTGKEGKGIIPVDRERVGPPAVYGEDRLFCYLRLESAPDAAQDAAVTRLEKAGKPVVRISVATPYDLGEEFFRWEIATAIAGSILGINAFNQPDVEASKIATRTLTTEYEKTGALPEEAPFFEGEGVKLFADAVNAEALQKAAGSDRSLAGLLKAHLGRLGAGDYFAILAYVPMTAAHEEAIQGFRHRVRDAKRVATCLGFGPRFLHSTGQGYKGGPNTRGLPPDHLRRREGPRGARAEVHLRHREGGPGPGRLPGAVRPQAPGPARASGAGRGGGPEDAGRGDPQGARLTDQPQRHRDASRTKRTENEEE